MHSHLYIDYQTPVAIIDLGRCKVPKPFVKWAGGKTQLKRTIMSLLPQMKEIECYIEPFLGGGAILFALIEVHSFKRVVASDINGGLINSYVAIRDDVDEVIKCLGTIISIYNNLDIEQKEGYFYKVREEYNRRIASVTGVDYQYAAEFIFLNRTCFNGLYRENSNGCMNSPFGKVTKNVNVDYRNIRKCSEALQGVEIQCCSYENTLSIVHETRNCFIYIDPPYRGYNGRGFTKYSSTDFKQFDHEHLSKRIIEIADRASIMVSNSFSIEDESETGFYEKHYPNFNRYIVKARRVISCDSDSRESVNEIILTNYRGNSLF